MNEKYLNIDPEANTNAVVKQQECITSSSKGIVNLLENDSGKSKILSYQVFSAFIISSAMAHVGVTLAFPNLLGKEFESESIATFASISALATALGTTMIGFFGDRIGRKKTIILLKCICVFTWLVVTLSRNPVFFYISSIFCGFTKGALTAICPTYIAEISQGEYRQLFLSLLTLFFTIGVFLVTILNKFLGWQEAAFCFSALFALIFALVTFFIPESPHWLATIKFDMEQAEIVQRKLFPDEKIFTKEWNSMTKKQENTTKSLTLNNKLAMIGKPKVYKPFIILLVLIAFQQICLIFPMTSFTVKIIPRVGHETGKSYNSEIFLIVGLLRLFLCILVTLFLAKFNQKQLLLISLGGMLVTALPIFCLQITSTESTDQSQTKNWINIILLLIYICTSSIGILGVPFTIIPELLPTEVRTLLGPVLVTIGYISMSGTLRIFPFILNTVSISYLFLFLGNASLVGFIFVYIFIPETKGKSLAEMEKIFIASKK